jgi:hypothetical protein
MWLPEAAAKNLFYAAKAGPVHPKAAVTTFCIN